MTHRKTHLWVSLVVGVLVWGAYFVHFAGMMWRGQDSGDLAFWFIGALAVVIVAESVATGMIAWLFRRRDRALDEGPTLQAALKASHVALMVLVGLALITAAGLAVVSLFGWTFDLSGRGSVLAANALLAMVVIAELTRAAFTLALLPRR